MFQTNINVLQIFITTILVFSALILFPFFALSKINAKESDRKKRIQKILLKIMIPEMLLFILGIFAIYHAVASNLL